jgi:hypothetical protein
LRQDNDNTLARIVSFTEVPGLRNEAELLAWKHRHETPIIYVAARLSGKITIQTFFRSSWHDDPDFLPYFNAGFRQQMRQYFDGPSFAGQDKAFMTAYLTEDPGGVHIMTTAGSTFSPHHRIVRGTEIVEALTTAIRAEDLADAFAWFEIMFTSHDDLQDRLEFIRSRTTLIHGITTPPGSIPIPTRSLNNEVAFLMFNWGLQLEFDVRLEGLVSAAHLNGREGVIRNQAVDPRRWRALLDDGSYVSVKAVNFVHIRRGEYRRRSTSVHLGPPHDCTSG